MALGIGTFIYAAREAWRGGLGVGTAVWLGIAFNLLMIVVPLLFSRDVYSYTLYGRIAGTYHANPYVTLPVHFSRDPIFSLAGARWRQTPAVYGPLFTLMSAFITTLIHSVTGLILTFKTIAAAASISTILVIKSLVGQAKPRRAAFAVVVFGWNPVVLFHSVASGHNDLLVALSIAGGLALLYRKHPLWATAVLTLGALVKVTAALPLVLLVIVAVVLRGKGERLRTFAKHAALVGGITLVFAAPFLQLSDPTLGMANLATHEGWLAPSRFFSRALGHWANLAAGHMAEVLVSGIVRACFLLTFAITMYFIVRWLLRSGTGRDPLAQGAAWGWSLLFLTFTGPVLLPWYIVWTLPLAWLLPRVPRTVVFWLSGLLAAGEMIAEPARNPVPFERYVLWLHVVVSVGCFALLLWLLFDFTTRLKSKIGLLYDDERGVGLTLRPLSPRLPRSSQGPGMPTS
jgi:hypothetical protein